MLAGLAVRASERGGRGVFATRSFGRGETIEECPLLVGPAEEWGGATQDYVFEIAPGTLALALGYGSLYNHGLQPNATYSHSSKHAFTFVATRPIRAGEEILVSYGSRWWTTRDIAPN